MQGPWKPEEDEQLRQLVEAKGNKWLDIGEVMGRMGEACRDRWRTIGLVRPRQPSPSASHVHAKAKMSSSVFIVCNGAVTLTVNASCLTAKRFQVLTDLCA